ncbi:MAG: hypothetical protein II796_00585 [Oscillospiraceae bacterium]|nr:hypothetical protein [Oscillospiraceae bacterium]
MYFKIETNDFKKLKTIILTTFLAVVAWLLLWFKIIIPGPLHLRFDFSLAVVLYATMLEGVCYGIYIEFILWLFSLLMGGSTMGIGPTVDFAVGLFAVITFAALLKAFKGKSVYTLLLCCAFFSMLWSMGINFLMQPLYGVLFGEELVQRIFKAAVLASGVFSFFKVFICGSVANLIKNRLQINKEQENS